MVLSYLTTCEIWVKCPHRLEGGMMEGNNSQHACPSYSHSALALIAFLFYRLESWSSIKTEKERRERRRKEGKRKENRNTERLSPLPNMSTLDLILVACSFSHWARREWWKLNQDPEELSLPPSITFCKYFWEAMLDSTGMMGVEWRGGGGGRGEAVSSLQGC